MARLSSKTRGKLPASDFAVSGRRYPIEDAAHARNALARVAQFGTPSMRDEVKRAVRRKFPGIKVT